jgi:hypothetical protein
MAAPIPAAAQPSDLPDFPAVPQESPAAAVAGKITDHLVDAVVPGAALAARILELAGLTVSQAPAPAATPQPTPGIQQRPTESEREGDSQNDDVGG